MSLQQDLKTLLSFHDQQRPHLSYLLVGQGVAMHWCPPSYFGLSVGMEGVLVYAGQFPELAFGGHGYGTHSNGIHGYRIIPYPYLSHHPGESAGELEQENHQCQCLVYIVMHQGETPRSDFPDNHGPGHGAPLSTCAGGQERGNAVELRCRHQLQAEIASSFSAVPPQHKY